MGSDINSIGLEWNSSEMEVYVDSIKIGIMNLNDLDSNIRFLNVQSGAIGQIISGGASVYTATEDCWAIGYIRALVQNSSGFLYICEGDSACLVCSTLDTTDNNRHMYPLKKGQSLKVESERTEYDFLFYKMM